MSNFSRALCERINKERSKDLLWEDAENQAVKKSTKKSPTKSSKSASSSKTTNNVKKTKKVISKKTSPKTSSKASTKKKENDVKSGGKKNSSPKKAKPKVDYKTRHHIGRRKATENVISYSQSGTTFFDLYTDYRTFNISNMKFPQSAKRSHDGTTSTKLPAKKMKLDATASDSGAVSVTSPSKDKENLTAIKDKMNIEKTKKLNKVTVDKGLKIKGTKKTSDTPQKETAKCKSQKKIENNNKESNDSKKSPKKKAVPNVPDVKPRGPWIRRQASLNAAAVMTLLYESEHRAPRGKEADASKTPVKSKESNKSTKKSEEIKKASKSPKSISTNKTKSDGVAKKKDKCETKTKASRTNTKTGKVQKVVAKSKPCKGKKAKGPYRFRELKNLLDCDNNDLDCDVLKSIQKGFFSKGMKRKINSSDIQLGVFAHKKREASLNAQAMLAASYGRFGGRRYEQDYNSSDSSTSESDFLDESDEQSSVVSSNSEIEVDEIINVVEDDDEDDMRAARVRPDAFKISRHVTTVHHTQEILGHWVEGLGDKESELCKESIEWTNKELFETQPQVTPVSPGNGLIVPVSQVPSPRMEVVKVTPLPLLQTPPLQSSPMQSSPLLMNGMIAPGGSPLPNGMIGPGTSPIPASYSYNNGAIIPTSHCQSFTLNGLGSISLMATYPQRYDSAFRVPSFNSYGYQNSGCYNQNNQMMQPVQDRYTHIVHHPIPVQPQQDLEIIFHHHNSHQTIKPCCSKTETVTCTVTHTQQHVNQKQPCQPQIQECEPLPQAPAPTSRQPLPPLPPPQSTGPQQYQSQQSAPQQYPPQPTAKQFSSPPLYSSQQTGSQHYSSQQSTQQHFTQPIPASQYQQHNRQGPYPHQQQTVQPYPSLSTPQQFSNQQSSSHQYQQQKSTRQFSHQTSSTQQFQHNMSNHQQYQPMPHPHHSPYPPHPPQQSRPLQNHAPLSLPANSHSVPVNTSLPSNPPKYLTLTAPPPKIAPGPPKQNVPALPPKSLPTPTHQTKNTSAPLTRDFSSQRNIPSTHSRHLPEPSSAPKTLPVAPPNGVSTPKQPALHPIPKPYTHPMPQTIPRPFGQSERELRKRPRSAMGVPNEDVKRMCLKPVSDVPVLSQMGNDKNNTEPTCQRQKSSETVVRDSKKRSDSEGYVEKSGTDQRRNFSGTLNVEKKKPERLSPRLLLSKEKSVTDVYKSQYEQTQVVSPKEKLAEKSKIKVTEKAKDCAVKGKDKERTLFNNNNKTVVNNNRKTAEAKGKLLNSKKLASVKTKLLSEKNKMSGQKLLSGKKSLKTVGRKSKLLLDKKSAKQKAKLLAKKKPAAGQRSKLLKTAGQRSKLLKSKKAVSVSRGPKNINCKKSPSDKVKVNIKKSSGDKSKLLAGKKSPVEKKRVDLKAKTGGVKVEPAGAIGARRLSNRTKSLNHSWQWVGEPEKKLVYTCNDMPGVECPCYSAICHSDGDIIKVRDCVLLRSGPRKKDLPFIAKIAAFFEKDGEKMMSILWYYRPEHTEAGRQPNHLPGELFASKHKDENSIACIEDKCLVLAVGKYCRYRSRLKLQEEHLPLSYSKQTLVPKADDVPMERLPADVDPETVFLCRQVYDFRQKRILKNPS